MNLNEAVVIITGGARGLGRAIALAYAGRGAKVAIVDILADESRQTVKEIEAAGGRALAVPTDVTVKDQVELMVATVMQQLGEIDVLINCAGSLSAIGPVWEVDPDRWWHDVVVNLRGTFLCCRAVTRFMVARGQGYVLNMVGGGVGDPHALTTGYGSSKTAVMRLTEGLAREARDHGVKVFAMQPGAVMTEMTRFILESPEGRKWRPQFKDIFDKGRDRSPDEIAQLAVNLVSGRADALTGRCFEVTRDFDETIANSDHILTDDLLTLRLRM